jgi:hypothetical protein
MFAKNATIKRKMVDQLRLYMWRQSKKKNGQNGLTHLTASGFEP